MTPLSKELEHLYDATWVVIDPWSYQYVPGNKHCVQEVETYINNVNEYYANMIYQYIQDHNINNVYTVNNHGIPTHRLFEKFDKWPSNSPAGNYVFVGYHSGICIKQKGTERLKAKKHHIPWVKADLTCTLAENWLTAKSIDELQYEFKENMSAYGDMVSII